MADPLQAPRTDGVDDSGWDPRRPTTWFAEPWAFYSPQAIGSVTNIKQRPCVL